MAATPRPWKAIFFETSQTWEVTNDAGGDLSEEFSIFEHLSEDDARLIVRSVNCHDELVAACRGMADRLGEYVDKLLADKRAGEAANIMRIVSTLRSVAAKAEEHT